MTKKVELFIGIDDGDTMGVTCIFKSDGDIVTYNKSIANRKVSDLHVKNRRGHRHARRNNDRRKMCKRLAKLFLEAHGLTITPELELTLRRLINKRGYTYLDKVETNEDGTVKNASNGGVKKATSRKEYLKRLQVLVGETKGCKGLRIAAQDVFDSKELSNIIGNINNLDLRSLRYFFNHFKNKDFDKLMFEAFEHFFNTWRTDSIEEQNDKQEKIELKKDFKSKVGAGNIVDFLKTTEPEKTIPPFECGDNRGAPDTKDLTLNPVYLNKEHGGWQDLVRKIISSYKNYFVEYEAKMKPLCENFYKERKKFLVKKKAEYLEKKELSESEEEFIKLSADDIYLSRALHYFLDMSYKKQNDIVGNEKTKLFWSSRGNWGCHYSLVEKLGDKIDLFKAIHKDYMGTKHNDEIMFSDFKESSILRVGWEKPKKKSNCKDELQAEALRIPLDSLRLFSKNAVEDILRAKSVEKIASGVKEEGKNKSTHKEIERLEKKAEDVYNELCGVIPVLKDKSTFYQNSRRYLISKLWNIVGKEGFSAMGNMAMIDNNLRSTYLSSGHTVAQALPMRPVKPFAGTVRKDKEIKVAEINKFVYESIESYRKELKEDISIDCNIVLESNAFSTSGNGNETTSTVSSDSDEDEGSVPLKKIERIISDCDNICPYSGEPINELNIDHIYPQAESLKHYGSVFNTEVNLIACDKGENKKKSNSIYELKDLNDDFLTKVYKTKDHVTLADLVQNFMTQKFNQIRRFDNLSKDERNLIRLALFIPKFRKQVLDKINNSASTRVNGSQKFLGGLLINGIKSYLNWKEVGGVIKSFSVETVPYEVVSGVRQTLKGHTYYEKVQGQSQPPVSHIVDAQLTAVMSKNFPRPGNGTGFNVGQLVGLLDRLNEDGNERVQRKARGKLEAKNNRQMSSKSHMNASLDKIGFLPIFARIVDGELQVTVGELKKVGECQSCVVSQQEFSKFYGEYIRPIKINRKSKLKKYTNGNSFDFNKLEQDMKNGKVNLVRLSIDKSKVFDNGPMSEELEKLSYKTIRKLK